MIVCGLIKLYHFEFKSYLKDFIQQQINARAFDTRQDKTSK